MVKNKNWTVLVTIALLLFLYVAVNVILTRDTVYTEEEIKISNLKKFDQYLVWFPEGEKVSVEVSAPGLFAVIDKNTGQFYWPEDFDKFDNGFEKKYTRSFPEGKWELFGRDVVLTITGAEKVIVSYELLYKQMVVFYTAIAVFALVALVLSVIPLFRLKIKGDHEMDNQENNVVEEDPMDLAKEVLSSCRDIPKKSQEIIDSIIGQLELDQNLISQEELMFMFDLAIKKLMLKFPDDGFERWTLGKPKWQDVNRHFQSFLADKPINILSGRYKEEG